MPYKSPGPGDSRLDWILTQVSLAQETLDARILEVQNLPDSDLSRASRLTRLNQMTREVNFSFEELANDALSWSHNDLPLLYTRGWGTAATQMGAGYSFTLPHKEALDRIASDAYNDVATGLTQVTEEWDRKISLFRLFEQLDPDQVTAIREQSRSAVAQMLLTGEDPRKISKLLAQDLVADGIKIQDAGGRRWRPESYTRMLIRTKSANAYNSGSLGKYFEEGVQRVRVFDGVEDDQECADANGQIWTLEYAMDHIIEHPNCRRAFAPEHGKGAADKGSEARILPSLPSIDRLPSLGALNIGLRQALPSIQEFLEFRRTGELNFATPLAQWVVGAVTGIIGREVPQLENVAVRFLSRQFETTEAWVESYIDPILFSAGLIKEVPSRAQMAAMRESDNVLRTFSLDLAERISRLRQTHPRVDETIRILNDIADRSEVIVRKVQPVAGKGAIAWVPFVGREIAQSKYGRQVYWMLIRENEDTARIIEQQWRSARPWVEQMVRTAHRFKNTGTIRLDRGFISLLTEEFGRRTTPLLGDLARAGFLKEGYRRPGSLIQEIGRILETGEVNASSVLAKRIIEGGREAMLDHLPVDSPLRGVVPFIEETALHTLSRGLRIVDKEIETYIDPVLYQAGLLRRPPSWLDQLTEGEELADVLDLFPHPKELVDAVAAFALTGTARLAVDYPGIRETLVKLNVLKRTVEELDLDDLEPIVGSNPVGWLAWISDQLSTANRYGQILSETLKTVETGEFRNIKLIWQESAEYVDQLRNIRTQYLKTLSQDQFEALKVYRRMDEVLQEMAELIDPRIQIDELPNLVGFLNDYDQITPLDLDNLFGFWINENRILRTTTGVTPREVEQMRELFDAAQRVRNEALEKMKNLDELIIKRSGDRVLTMPAPSGPDFPSAFHTLWDIDQFEEASQWFADGVLQLVRESRDVVNMEVKKSVAEFFKLFSFSAVDFPDIATHRNRLAGFLRPTFEGLEGFVDPEDIANTDELVTFFTGFLSRIDSNRAGRLLLDGDEVTDDMAQKIGIILRWLDDSYWDQPARWKPVADLHWDALFLERHLPGAVEDSASQMKNLYRGLVRSIERNNGTATQNPYADIGNVLRRAFGNSNVDTLMDKGVNGTIYTVTNPDTGQVLVVKRLIAGHQGGTSPALASQQLTNYLREALGDVPALPYQFVQMTEDSNSFLIVAPLFREGDSWANLGADLARNSDLRSLTFFDLLAMEGDGNLGNYMINPNTLTSIAIDREMSFGVWQGMRFVDQPINGISGSGARSQFEINLVKAWRQGDDLSIRTDPPVRLFPLTEDEVIGLTGMTRSDVLREIAKGDNHIKNIMVEVGVVFDAKGNGFIPAGRIGRTRFTGRFIPEWQASVFPTESELNYIRRVYQPTKDFRDIDEWHTIRRKLAEIYESPGVTDDARGDFQRWWEAESVSFDKALDAATDQIFLNIYRRIEMSLQEGLINVTGGIQQHVDELTGEILEYGKVYSFTNDAGESVSGVVVNIFEGDLTSGRRSALVLPDIGVNKSASELQQTVISPRKINLDEWRWGEMAGDTSDIGVTLTKYDTAKDSFIDLINTPRNAGNTRHRPVIDRFGVKVGFEEEAIDFAYQESMSSTIKIVGNDGSSRILTFKDFIETPALERAIREEIANIPPETRPKRIKVSFSKLTTEDGRSAFGLFDPDTGELHISLAPLFDTPEVTPRSGWDNSWFYDADISDWKLTEASIQHWVGTLNIDGVRGVLRHELGHAVETGVERMRLNLIRIDVMKKLTDEVPELDSMDDLIDLAEDLLPDGFDASGFDNALEALVAHRAGLVEDVVNTNLVFDAKEILEKGLESGELPAWARGIYAGILREEPEAHHELYAEIWRRLRDDTTNNWVKFASLGLADQSFAKVADDLGVDEKLVRRFITRGETIVTPDVWDMSDGQFVSWLSRELSPAADRIVPLSKNRNRVLWNAERYNRSDIRTRVLHTRPEEGGGGITINLVTGEEPQTGFAVAKKSNERIIDNVTTDQEFDDALNAYLDDFADQLEQEDWMLGIWLEEDTGQLFLDTSKVFDDEISAAAFGFREQQKAMHRLDDHVDLDLLKKHATVEDYVRAQPHLEDLPYEDLIARTKKLGGVVRNIGSGADKVIEEVFEPQGNAFRVMSLDWLSEADRKKVLDSLQDRYTKAITQEQGKGFLNEILERGLELYAENPELQDEYGDFYFFWRDTFVDAAAETLNRPIQIQVDWIAAAAARMSPAMKAEANLVTVLNFADVLSRDIRMTKKIIAETKASINRSIDGAQKRLAKELKKGRSKKVLEKVAKIEAEIARLETVRDSYRVNQKLNNMDPYRRVRALAGVLYAEDRAPVQVSRAWSFLEGSVAVMLGEVSPHEILTDTKIRPFYNNIMDPGDILNMREVTIDFLMAEAFFQARGFNNIAWTVPSRNDISIGLRPIISDTLRELYDERWASELGLVSDSQLQSHVWNLWRYGVDNGWWDDLETIKLVKKKKG